IILPGEEITVKYNADSSNLAGNNDIKLVAYLYDDNLYKTTDITLAESGNIYTGKIKTDKNTLGVILKFVSVDKIDNNKENGYTIFLSNKNGERIPGSLAGYGVAINTWGSYYLDLDRDKEKAFNYIKEDIDSNPDIKNKFLDTYFEIISSIKPEKKDDIIKQELNYLEKENPESEEALLVLNKWYGMIGDDSKAKLYENILLENYPLGKYAEDLKVKEFKLEKDVNKKLELARNFENKFPESEYVQYTYDITANVYRDNQEYESALEFLKENVDKTSTYRFYSVVKRMIDENADMNIALSIAGLGVERSVKELSNPVEKQPEYFSEREWFEEREYIAGLNNFGMGKALYNLNRREEALEVLKEAAALTKEKDDLINELYAKVLIENGKYAFAMSKISDFIKTGHGTSEMKSYLREAYLNEEGTENGFDTYAAQFEDAARELLINRLKNEMMLEPAPKFTLHDLSGSAISLQDYRNKTVIIDFWATWCAPCRESFPAMKKSVEKFQDDDNVKFLFINSWERTDKKLKNASDFMTRNDYPFHVLLDEENKVIEKYKVSGIPTKFVIDSEGNIRFKSVGFEGSDDKLVEEISTMISLIN
ncbi:MAG: redoxin domain-containing protein, partial [Ignavibacteria bacterium]